MIREEVIYKYITDDGKEFNNKKDARIHEISLVYKDLFNMIEYKKVGQYELFRVFNIDELDSIFYYYDRLLDINGQYNDLKFPFILCRIATDTQYEFIHIDDLINRHSYVLKELVRYKEME